MKQIQIKNKGEKWKIAKRYPRLDSVLMVEQTIKESSGEYTIYQLWKKLPKKMMYQIYKLIINYLEEINKIITEEDGKIVYIWNPELYEKIKNRPAIKI